MLDHVTIGVGDIKRSKGFYDRALRPLGIECLYTEGETFAGYGANRKAFFWIGLSSTLRILGRVTERFHESLQQGGGNFYGFWVFPGCR